MEIFSLEFELFSAELKRDMTKLIVAFSNFAKTPIVSK
jgi:hypothetical protein